MATLQYYFRKSVSVGFLAAIFLLLPKIHAKGQSLTKEVYVVKPYEPSLSEVNKLNFMPEFDDTTYHKPAINYNITPSLLEIPFDIRPIKPAKMVGATIDKLYRHYAKAGLGNYFTPLLSYKFNNLRSKDYAVGASFDHRSSPSKIVLENDAKTPAGYSKTHMELYGKQFYENATLQGNMYTNIHGVHYYGYNTALFPDTALPEIKRKEIKQRFTRIGASANISSNYTDTTKLAYKLGLHYNYIQDKFDIKENELDIQALFRKKISRYWVHLNTGFEHYASGQTIDSSNHSVITVHPFMRFTQDNFTLRLGLSTSVYSADETSAYFYPDVKITIHLIEGILATYLGADGAFNKVSYNELSQTNPFIVKGANPGYTDTKYHIFGGLDGRMTSKINYNIGFGFSQIDHAFFFINDTTSQLENKFITVTDNVELFTLNAGLGYQVSENFRLQTAFNWYNYTTTDQEAAWHKPKYDFFLESMYNIKDKVVLHLELLGIGPREVYKHTEAGFEVQELNPFVDLNLGIEYKYSSTISAYLDLHNLVSKEYQLWNQYPSQKLFVTFALSYKF